MNGTHRRIDDVRSDLGRLHDDHSRLDERLRAMETRSYESTETMTANFKDVLVDHKDVLYLESMDKDGTNIYLRSGQVVESSMPYDEAVKVLLTALSSGA